MPTAVQLEALLRAMDAAALTALRQQCRGAERASDAELAAARAVVAEVLAALSIGGPRHWSAVLRAAAALTDGAATVERTLPSSDGPIAPRADVTIPLLSTPTLTDAGGSAGAGAMVPDATTAVTVAPHAGPVGPEALELDVERYAVLCAWCSLRPAQRQTLQLEWGLSDENERAELDRAFDALFAADPALHATFERRLAFHQGWLAQQSPPGDVPDA